MSHSAVNEDFPRPMSVPSPLMYPTSIQQAVSQTIRATRERDELRAMLVLEVRDRKSLSARNTMLLHAVRRETVSVRLAIAKDTAIVGRLLDFARTTEAQGNVPDVRLVRDVHGYITGVELVILKVTATEDEQHVPVDGMDVTDGDDGFVARLTAAL